MNKDQIKGRAKKTKGTVKEATGKALGDDKLQAKGKVEKLAGSIQATYGDTKNDISKNS